MTMLPAASDNIEECDIVGDLCTDLCILALLYHSKATKIDSRPEDVSLSERKG